MTKCPTLAVASRKDFEREFIIAQCHQSGVTKRVQIMKIRLDVDYAYPSRIKSFVFTALSRKTSKDYLKNAKIIARMIEESPREIQAYWFFTPPTWPDDEMLSLLSSDKHKIALHVTSNPYEELRGLEKATGRDIEFYTIHGTERLLARIIWKRKLWESRTPIPADFPLKSFHEFPTLAFDRICHNSSISVAVTIAEASIEKGEVLEIHPEWLFQSGTINHRGPFYGPLRQILQVDRELDQLVIRKKAFLRIAKLLEPKEYMQDFVPTEEFIQKLRDRAIDIFTFIERKWCSTIANTSNSWIKVADNIALLKVASYEDWWRNIGKKTRNMNRKAEKTGIAAQVVMPSEELAEGIWKIYNETPIRQERAFPHYGESLPSVKNDVFSPRKGAFIGAFLENRLVGFIQLLYGDNIAIISQILSLQEFWGKAVNNALLAKTVEFCSQNQMQWIMYGRMGNHPSLDKFKQSNDFKKFSLTRYFVPITKKGQVAIKLGLHNEAKDILPQRIKYSLIPIYNWISRRRVQIKR
jgi:lambda repressor-like predicted transcriptional regulator